MAFPTIRSSNSGYMIADALNVTLTLPTGHAEGDLLIIGVSLDGSRTMSAPEGWTLLANPTNTTANRHQVWYKTRGSTENDPQITWLTTVERGTWYTIAITAGTWSGTPEVATYYASTNLPNPPSLTASWGAMDNLWLALVGWDYNRTCINNPTNYTNITYQSGSYTTSAGHRTFYRQYNSATDDPSTITLSASDTTYSHTVVIKPFVLPDDPMNIAPNIGGVYKDVESVSVNIGGVWKSVEAIYVNIGGSWKNVAMGGTHTIETPTITNVSFAPDFENFPYYILTYRVYNQEIVAVDIYSGLDLNPPTISRGSCAAGSYKSITITDMSSAYTGTIYAQAKLSPYNNSAVASYAVP